MHEQPYRQNPLLRLSYSLIAPLYDFVIERPMREARKRSLAALPADQNKRILISGAGTGLDLPWLPAQHRYLYKLRDESGFQGWRPVKCHGSWH